MGRQSKRTELDADFTEFVEANAHRIRALAQWLRGDPDRAADLAQSALERTYARWGRIQSGDPMAYVRKALLNQQRDWWRRRQHRPEWPTADVPDVRSQDDHAIGFVRQDVLLAALGQLSGHPGWSVAYAMLPADPPTSSKITITVSDAAGHQLASYSPPRIH